MTVLSVSDLPGIESDMSTDTVPIMAEPPGAVESKGSPPKILVPRHKLIVRINHWINVVALSLMLMSGLNIFNAHPALYWGQYSTFDHPWLSLTATQTAKDGVRGVTHIGPVKIDTTGLLGASKEDGMIIGRGFPAWITIPHTTYLSDARNWHFFWAWVFALNGAIYLISGLFNRHLIRDIIPAPKDLLNVPRDVIDHVLLHFHKGWAATRYGPLQRIAYAGIALVVLPVIVLTGMTMSPALDSAFPFLLHLFGGRQSARSIHFICAMLAVGFIVIHLVMVLLTGPFNQVRGMITGKFLIEDDHATNLGKDADHEPA
jgi:thiosulfate reductase cytochrome b subunit